MVWLLQSLHDAPLHPELEFHERTYTHFGSDVWRHDGSARDGSVAARCAEGGPRLWRVHWSEHSQRGIRGWRKDRSGRERLRRSGHRPLWIARRAVLEPE